MGLQPLLKSTLTLYIQFVLTKEALHHLNTWRISYWASDNGIGKEEMNHSQFPRECGIAHQSGGSKTKDLSETELLYFKSCTNGQASLPSDDISDPLKFAPNTVR